MYSIVEPSATFTSNLSPLISTIVADDAADGHDVLTRSERSDRVLVLLLALLLRTDEQEAERHEDEAEDYEVAEGHSGTPVRGHRWRTADAP